ADAPHRPDDRVAALDRFGERLTDLREVNVDRAIDRGVKLDGALVAESSRLRKEVRTANDLALLGREDPQQVELVGRELDLVAPQLRLSTVGVDRQAADVDPSLGLGGARAAAQDGANPSEKLAGGEGFGQVVIRA